MAKYAAELSPRGLEDSPFPRGDTIKHLKGFKTPTYRLRIIHRSELNRALRDLA